MAEAPMTPQTPEEMRATLYNVAIMRLYGAITLAARRKRLTEYDISLIERTVLRDMQLPEGLAEEFATFEAEPQFKIALAAVSRFMDVSRAERKKLMGEL